jgi:hypothetical protein
MRRLCWLAVLALAGCGDDYAIKVVPYGVEASEEGWDVMRYDEVGAECMTNGRVLFRRPKYTTHLAAATCYTNGRKQIIVSLRLPDAPWREQGWTRCTPSDEQNAIACCQGKPDIAGRLICP